MVHHNAMKPAAVASDAIGGLREISMLGGSMFSYTALKILSQAKIFAALVASIDPAIVGLLRKGGTNA
jgi:hypothetical protein